MPRILVLLAFCLTTQIVYAADSKPNADFLKGLDALENAQYKSAAQSFSDAIESDEENVNLFIARAVANMLAENFAPAEKDLGRALRLQPGNTEARMWLASLYDMKGDFMKGSDTYSFAQHNNEYLNTIRRMSHDYGELSFRSQQPENAPYLAGPKAQRAKALAQFPEIARMFAGKFKGATGDIAPLLFERAKKEMADKNWAAALVDLQKAAVSRPNDFSIMHFRAFCNVYLGAPAAAREQFTRVLTANPTWASTYNGRAMAAAQLGDHRRAAADLARAIELDPKNAETYQSLVAAAIKTNPAPTARKEDLAPMLANLQKQAGGDATDDQLLQLALDLIRAANNLRLRADETYFQRRLTFELAIQKSNSSPDALADLGEFLYREAISIRGENVEPRAPFKTYRPQTDQSQQQEISRAVQVLDMALAANPNHVKALTFKAGCLTWYAKWGDAETLLRKALAIDSTYGPLLETLAQVLNHAAAMKSAAAMDLRSTKSWSDLHYIYTRWPSQAELALADQYEKQARQLWTLAEKHLEAAARTHAGKPDGFYYSGVLAKNRGDAAGAQAAFEQCVKLDPTYVSAWDQLTGIYWASNRARDAVDAKSAAVNLSHTTAGPLLHFAWGPITRTAYKTARQALTDAMAIDPADPRISAYLAVIADANDQKPEAMAWYRAAASLEQAIALLNGVSIRSKAGEILNPNDASMTLAIHLRLGRLALANNRPDIALSAFQNNIGLCQRIPKPDRFGPLASSMLPDMETDPTKVPEADNVLSLLAWSYTGAGQALLAQKNPEQARKYFEATLILPSERPPTVAPNNRLGDPWVTAKIALIKSLIEQGKKDEAKKVAFSYEQPGGASKELGDELRILTQQLQQDQANQANADYIKQLEEAQKQRQAEIDRINKQRAEQQKERDRNRPPRTPKN